jgi:hypothetical protein
MAVRHRIVIADHHEQHRQREVGVVHRALLADDSRHRVGLAPGADVGDHSLLSRNDVKEHVGDHHRADHRADMDEGRARAEDMEERPGGNHDQCQHCAREGVLMAGEHAA